MFKYLMLIFITNSAYAQEAFMYERYTQAWVKNGDEFNKQYPIESNQSLKIPRSNSVILNIPPKANTIERNGGKYIKAYLINNTSGSLKLSRSDATIAYMVTEIKVDGEWKIFQIKQSATCGNSYWTMDFLPKHYLVLEVENRPSGEIEVPFRVKIKMGDNIIISNPTTIHVSQKLLALAGTVPKDFFSSTNSVF